MSAVPADGAAWTDLRGVINITQRTKCACQLVVGIAGAVMGVAAWATAGRMALLGNWLPSSITMCAAAWMMSVSETAFDRMLARRLKR